MIFDDLGLIPFSEALAVQADSLDRIAAHEQQETVYLLEHPSVFTMGRGGQLENVLTRRDWEGNSIELVRTSRGGDVTYHGPGQLVGYLHLDLRQRGRDVGQYLRDLEETLIRAGAHFGVTAFRRKGLTGVWTRKGKLASIGVGVRRWITMHGFALNVNNDLRYFELIRPCGIPDCPVTSFKDLLGVSLELDEVKEVYEREFRSVFVARDPWPLQVRDDDRRIEDERCVDVEPEA